MPSDTGAPGRGTGFCAGCVGGSGGGGSGAAPQSSSEGCLPGDAGGGSLAIGSEDVALAGGVDGELVLGPVELRSLFGNSADANVMRFDPGAAVAAWNWFQSLSVPPAWR